MAPLCYCRLWSSLVRSNNPTSACILHCVYRFSFTSDLFAEFHVSLPRLSLLSSSSLWAVCARVCSLSALTWALMMSHVSCQFFTISAMPSPTQPRSSFFNPNHNTNLSLQPPAIPCFTTALSHARGSLGAAGRGHDKVLHVLADEPDGADEHADPHYNELRRTRTNYNELRRSTTNYDELRRALTNHDRLRQTATGQGQGPGGGS